MAQKGKEAWNKGLTKETDKRVKECGEKNKGKKMIYKDGHPKGMLGKKHSKETRHIVSEKMKEVVCGRVRNKVGQFQK